MCLYGCPPGDAQAVSSMMVSLGRRYIELNPVRAAMCQDPARYPWSSYRANALGEVLPDNTFADIHLALNQTQPLGNNRFFDAIEQATGQRREPKPRGRPRKPE